MSKSGRMGYGSFILTVAQTLWHNETRERILGITLVLPILQRVILQLSSDEIRGDDLRAIRLNAFRTLCPQLCPWRSRRISSSRFIANSVSVEVRPIGHNDDSTGFSTDSRPPLVGNSTASRPGLAPRSGRRPVASVRFSSTLCACADRLCRGLCL